MGMPFEFAPVRCSLQPVAYLPDVGRLPVRVAEYTTRLRSRLPQSAIVQPRDVVAELLAAEGLHGDVGQLWNQAAMALCARPRSSISPLRRSTNWTCVAFYGRVARRTAAGSQSVFPHRYWRTGQSVFSNGCVRVPPNRSRTPLGKHDPRRGADGAARNQPSLRAL